MSRKPATLDEQAEAVNAAFAALAVILSRRKTPLRLSAEAVARIEGAGVRVGWTSTGGIVAFLTDMPADTRAGVLYRNDEPPA